MSGTPKPLQNVYYERKVATERPCYICKRSTTTVLATIDTKDFLYTCESHLSDRAVLISPPPTTPAGPSQEDIRKVISDYKAREAKKAESKDGTGKDGEKDKDTESAPASPASKPTSPPPAASPAPSHRKYALHRQIFEMRQNDIKRKEMGVKAREVGKGEWLRVRGATAPCTSSRPLPEGMSTY